MGKIFITSDLHFCHNKEFLYGPRNFSNIDEMNCTVFTLYNKIISPEDEVYILGDLMLNDNEEGLRLIEQLNGRIHVAIGNHDTDSRIELYKTCSNIVDIQWAYRLKYKGYRFFLTHYPTLCGNWDDGRTLREKIINLCGHVHTQDPFYHWDAGAIFHCELDTNACFPWYLDNIIYRMEERYKNG